MKGAIGEIDWGYSSPGGESKVNCVVDCEEQEASYRERWAKDEEQRAKEVRVVTKPLRVTRVDGGLAVELIPGDVLTHLSQDYESPLRFEFDSAHGRCTITSQEVGRQTGVGSSSAFPPQQQ